MQPVARGISEVLRQDGREVFHVNPGSVTFANEVVEAKHFICGELLCSALACAGQLATANVNISTTARALLGDGAAAEGRAVALAELRGEALVCKVRVSKPVSAVRLSV